MYLRVDERLLFVNFGADLNSLVIYGNDLIGSPLFLQV